MEELLLAWYSRSGRDLPWRHTTDPYAILVSEVMLQQTQVDRVIPRYLGWLERWPTATALAEAPTAEVIRAWQGLGYNRRALALHRAAQAIASDGWPDDLTRLAGVGRYTAGAVRAQADDIDVPAIEVNVRRVVERVAGRRLTTNAAEAESIRLGRGLAPRDRLLALMDVGALLCRPRVPACRDCPLRRRCATRGPFDDETRHRQQPFEGSFRQRRGRVMARLRVEPKVAITELDGEALSSLVSDGLAVVDGGAATLP